MSQTQTWTIGRLLEWTTDYLRKNGSDSPRLDAEVLLSHSRQCQRIHLYTSFDQEPDEATRASFREMVRRRAEGTPVAYLVGHKEFYSLDFVVTPDVLIPRGETEHLVIEVLDRAKAMLKGQNSPTKSPIRIADLCTGSGCIAISIAKHLPQSQILAIDISPAAIRIAQSNSERLVPQGNIEFLQSDLFHSLRDQTWELPFDIVVSNPPYVSEEEYTQLSKSVREHEPKLALVADEGGMALIKRLLEETLTRVRKDGCLIFEFSPMLMERVLAEVRQHPSWRLEKTIKDLAGLARAAVLVRT